MTSTLAERPAAPPPEERPRLARAQSLDRLRDRLLGVRATDRLWGWLGPLLIAAIGGFFRFWQLGRPHQLVFDETYYVKQGYSIWNHGIELANQPNLKTPDALFTRGTPDVFTTYGDSVVHPPVGKWMIGFGESLFGINNSYGWRFASAVVGTLSILMLARIARRLFGSTLLGCVAGLLLAVDGEHFVHSRTGLLDIFVMFWALAAFGFVLIDRDWARAKLARKVAGSERRAAGWVRPRAGRAAVPAGGRGLPRALLRHQVVRRLLPGGLRRHVPALGPRRPARCRRPRLGARRHPAGRCHWLPVHRAGRAARLRRHLGRLVPQHRGVRPAVGARPPLEGLRLDPRLAALAVALPPVDVPVPHAPGLVPPVPRQPVELADPGAPDVVLLRGPKKGTDGCQVAQCSKAITSLGTPSIWWGATLALLVLLFMWVLRRDWRAGAILAGLAAGYLPWFQYEHRTIFTFYSVAFVPWVVLAVTYVIGLVLGPPQASSTRRLWGGAAVGTYLVGTVWLFFFFWPIYTAQVIPYADWARRMWFPSWI